MREPNPVIEINKYNLAWRRNLPAVKSGKDFFDEKNKIINPFYHEIFEQYFMNKWLKQDDIVLELGGRYGIVSCTINSILKNKKNQVVIEPDKTVLNALKKNKKTFGAKFSICDKALSDKPLKMTTKGLSSFTEESKMKINNKNLVNKNLVNIKFKDFMEKYNLQFNVLVADCEGCLYSFLNDAPLALLKNIEMIIFEKDGIEYTNYEEIYKKLKRRKFIKVDTLLDDFQQVWIRIRRLC
jgi:FkbM family methyltransferase